MNGHPLLDYKMYEEIFTCGDLCDALDLLAPNWTIGTRGGDKVKAGSQSHQLLHSDWPEYSTRSMKKGFALAVSLAVHDVPSHRAAIRVVPWSAPGWTELDDDGTYADCIGGMRQGFYAEMLAGDILIRDVRAAHAGSANHASQDRVLPGVQIYHPWTWVSDGNEKAAKNEK